MVNLVTNAIEAMTFVADRSRELIIRSERHEDDITTKLGGMGMGLSLRSIIEAHGARPRATALRSIALNSLPSAS